MTGAEVHPGLLVIAAVGKPEEANPSNGWPATAQVGAFDRRLLVQDRIWIDPYGTTHNLEDLSDDHRNLILGTLLDMELELEMASRARVGADLAAGTLDRAAALRDLDALAALGSRWVESTPLVRRLLALSGVTLPGRPLDNPRGPTPSRRVRGETAELQDTDGGLWRVSTEISVYLIDLDLRRLLRSPGAVRRTHLNLEGELVWAREFDTDNAWHKLARLEVCRRGEPMEARATFAGREAPIRSTKVTVIELAEPP